MCVWYRHTENKKLRVCKVSIFCCELVDEEKRCCFISVLGIKKRECFVRLTNVCQKSVCFDDVRIPCFEWMVAFANILRKDVMWLCSFFYLVFCLVFFVVSAKRRTDFVGLKKGI